MMMLQHHEERWLARLCDARPDAPAPPRTLLVLAHPDDEVVGAGARLAALRGARLLTVTDGAPRDGRDASAAGYATRADYARARRAERSAALAHAGIADDRVIDLHVADQEASLALVWLARRIAELVLELAPDVILTHPYEGGHPDHDATAFAVHGAVQRLRRSRSPAPCVLECTSYHEHDGALVTGRFPLDGFGSGRAVPLDDDALVRKRAMLDAYRSQQRTLAQFTLAPERFRLAPRYDFTAPPPAGPLWYERFDWGMRGDRWRRLAREASDRLSREAAA